MRIPAGGSTAGSGATGWVRVEDINPTLGGDSVDNKVFDVSSTILQSCRSSSLSIDIDVLSAFPVVTIDSSDYTLAQAADGGHYEDTVSVVLSAAGSITVTSKTSDDTTGARDTFALTLEAPPALLTLSFTAGYPGSQTELKAGDTFQITGTADKSIDAIQVLDSGAGTGELLTFAAGTSFTTTMTIANRGTTLQALAASAQGRDTLTAAFGATRATNTGGGSVDGTDLVNLNNLFPTVSWGSITYPVTQSALKASESATVVISTSDLDTILFDSPNGDLSITNTTTDETPKTVTRIAGSYNVSTNNLRATANRAANDADTVDQTIVSIANVAPTIDITLPAARLISGGNNGTSAQDHAVTITSNQNLLSAPSLAADSGGNRGTFVGGAFTGGPTVWTRDIRVDETVPDEKGTFTFESLSTTGLAGLTQTTINSGASYTLGGFAPRTLTFASFATTTSIGTSVETFANLTAGTFTSTAGVALKQSIGTSPPVINGYTIDALSTNPTSLIWLDTAAAGANSGGTATITNVEETA